MSIGSLPSNQVGWADFSWRTGTFARQLSGALVCLGLAQASWADPCCVQQSTFTNGSSSVAIHGTSGISERFFDNSSFDTQSVSSVGFESIIQSDLQIYNIPLYHGIPFSLLGGEEFLNFAVLLPYVINEVGLNDFSGLGDVYLGAQYYQGRKGIVRKVGVGLKTATGDYVEGLGTDSLDFSVYGRLAKRFKRYTLSATSAYTFKGSTGDDFVDYGDQINIKGGYEYHYNRDLSFTTGLLFTRQANNELGVAKFEAAGYLGYDLEFGVNYNFRKNLILNVDVAFPISEHALDGGDDPDRDPVLRLNVSTNY